MLAVSFTNSRWHHGTTTAVYVTGVWFPEKLSCQSTLGCFGYLNAVLLLRRKKEKRRRDKEIVQATLCHCHCLLLETTHLLSCSDYMFLINLFVMQIMWATNSRVIVMCQPSGGVECITFLFFNTTDVSACCSSSHIDKSCRPSSKPLVSLSVLLSCARTSWLLSFFFKSEIACLNFPVII